jgi:integrase
VSVVAAARVPRGTMGREFAHVLAGVLLDGDAARLAAALDPAFLAGAGWDPATWVLSPPAGHRLLGRAVCTVTGCQGTPYGGVACQRCRTRLTAAGMTAAQITSAADLPPAPVRAALCAVPGCRREPYSARITLCRPHRQRFRRSGEPAWADFLADPRVQPLGPDTECAVTACSRPAEEGKTVYCASHGKRWRAAAAADPGLAGELWRETEPPVAGAGIVSLRALPPLVAVQVLAGLQQRTRDGIRTTGSELRVLCRALAVQKADSAAGCDIEAVRPGRSRHLLRGVIRHAYLLVSDPASEQAAGIWDLAVFGHHGRLDFTGITQQWLRESAKRWASHDLPRRRGSGHENTRAIISAAARLSESLRTRPDRGDQPAMLSRRDIENFLSRLAYLESAGTISRHQRNLTCRGARTILAAARDLGLARPGEPASGLPGDVTITTADIPARPERGEPARDIPAEIITVLCAGLDSLKSDDLRAVVEIAIDTGRRPDEILTLQLDCLTRDAGGAPVLIYDNIKAYRDGRRLPVSEHTAAAITAQQERVAARFPATPRGDLPMFPTPRCNPDGRKRVCTENVEHRHREWITGLGPLRTRDGTVLDSAKIVLYSYRHTYAQRHADAGVPIDVLAQLMDHRHLDVTRGYYRVGEDRRRDAVDKVTAMQFDRHGNRTWRDARALLDSEHARYAVGQVAVPYGTCCEPSNVAAGGTACPVRFRCAGCDHFRTDVSYLPDLTAYLDDLLRTRERLAAAVPGVDDWARADAMPSDEEITRIRRLISQVKGDIAQLSDVERAGIDEAVTVIRTHRTVHLGMPGARRPAPAQEKTA